MLAASLWMSSATRAQEQKEARPAKPATLQTAEPPGSSNYTYRLFIAPNKVYGYDIFQNGRLVFHQPALAEPAGDVKTGLTAKRFADKAALLAIEKIKKGRSPELTRQELAQVATQ